MVVYVDLDGTLADNPQVQSNKEYWKLANEPGFFENLPLLPWAKQLIAYLEDLGVEYRILTGTGHRNGDVAGQKIRWVRKHFPQIPKANIITLVSGHDKHHYVTKDSILIDDNVTVLEMWEAFDGIPILVSDKVIDHLAEKITC